MPDNPRMPGHPSDMPSSRSSEGSAGSVASGPGNYQTTPPPSQDSSSGNRQTRNIIIGSIATIIASTTVYYLTQYVNNKKSDSTPSHLVVKEATTSAWKRYVTLDNLYYKNIQALLKDKSLLSNLDNYKIELFKEGDNFIKDVETIMKEKDIDKAFISMVNRRIDREKESNDVITKFYDKLKAISRSNLSDVEQQKQLIAAVTNFQSYSQTLLERAATELEDLSKILANKHGEAFTLDEFLFYKDYKKGLHNINDSNAVIAMPSGTFATNIDPKSLIGTWSDGDNTLALRKDNTVSYILDDGDKAIGTWKIENDKLKLDAVSIVTKIRTTWLFNLGNITTNSFTMTLNSTPFDVFYVSRIKDDQ